MLKDELVGVWNLVGNEFHWSDGESADLYGPDATGMLIYGRQGQMSVQIMRAGRPAFASGDFRHGTGPEITAAFEGYLAYFGSYAVDEAARTVTHAMRGSLFPNWVGQDLTRMVELSGQRLTLRTPPMATAGRTFSGMLAWERVR
jgi:Lipocalin-like domain